MDPRVQELGDELGNATSISPVEIRDRILDLFGQVRQESDRVTLLQMFNATMGVAVRHLEAKGEDTNGLLSAITADKRLLAIQESQIDGENVDPATLHYVVEREIAAGRMEPDSFQSLALAGAQVLGGNTGEVASKEGFWRRVWGG